MAGSQWRAGVDIGGTFTDLLLVDGQSGRFRVGKVLTTVGEPAAAVRAALAGELQAEELSPESLGTVVHGTTLVTNAVIERKGTVTALLITEGFRDTLLIGREHRYDMYDARLEKPEPLVPRRLTFAVPERVLADGTVHRPLDDAAVAALADELRARGVRAVGVCLLHAYRHPEHELRVREILQHLPAGQADLPGALLIWANEHSLAPQAPLFFSRKRGADGGLKPISRVQAWTILKAASERADVRVLALRASHHGAVGEPAPAHPHLFRHARVRQIVRTTRNLPLAQRQAGWSRLQMAYLTVGDEEARQLMQEVPE